MYVMRQGEFGNLRNQRVGQVCKFALRREYGLAIFLGRAKQVTNKKNSRMIWVCFILVEVTVTGRIVLGKLSLFAP